MLITENLSVTYPNGYRAIQEVNLNIEAKGICGILGPNGSGKTTLIKAILDLVPHKGNISLKGKAMSAYKKKIAYLEQRNQIDMDFPISVFQCVLLGVYPNLGLFKRPSASDKEAVLEALKQVNMLEYKDRQIGELSGGQFQRILIARALVQQAEILFLDEPFVGVDINSEKLIIDLLKDLAKEGKIIYMVHHDMTKIEEYFDKLILIDKKIIAHGETKEVFTKENMRKTFSVFELPLFNE